MKLSEIRPCDNCGGKIAPSFYLLKCSIAVFAPQAVNQTLGLAQMLGRSLELAELMGGDVDAVKIGGEEFPELYTTLFLCQDCFLGVNDKPKIDLARLMEKVNEAKEKKSEQDGLAHKGETKATTAASATSATSAKTGSDQTGGPVRGMGEGSSPEVGGSDRDQGQDH